MTKLHILWWSPLITQPLPHEIRPPQATKNELDDLQLQRNTDIWIKWLTWPIKRFEDCFKAFLDNTIKYTVSFNSGTSGLLAAYFSLWIQSWDEIIWPALTYHAALSPAFLLQANVILCDIDRNSRCIDPDKIESLITQKTKAITVVHQWWYPADMDKIMVIAKKHNLKVIEDCSHAHWSKYKWQYCWTFGDVWVFSLQTNKAIFAWEWWILVTNNEEIYNKATLLWHYRDRSKNEIRDPEYQKFWVTWFWQKLRMSPFNAIVAYHSLISFPKIKEWRHKCLHYFTERLKEIDYIETQYINIDLIDMWAWYWFKPIYLPEKLNNLSITTLVKALQSEWMEVSIPSWWILADQPLYGMNYNPLFWTHINKTANKKDTLPTASFLDTHALSLPTFYDRELHKSLIDEYIHVLKKIKNNINELLRLNNNQ